MKYHRHDEQPLHLAGPAAAVARFAKGIQPKTEKRLHELYEVLGVLAGYPPTAGVVVETRFPGTSREHVVVAPCRLLTSQGENCEHMPILEHTEAARG